MSERDGFLKMIAANPNDDAVRLVFADWLDEHNDPLGEFIRLQIELELLRIPCDDPKLEHDRVKRLRKIPPGEDQSRDDWPLAEKINREAELLEENRDRWLNGLLDRMDSDSNHFEVEFRRGFPETVQMGVSGFLPQGKIIRQRIPTLQKLILFGTFGRGEELASCPAISGVSEVVVAGWLNNADVANITRTPHFSNLKKFSYWLRAYEQDDWLLAQTLGSYFWRLKEFNLVQMWGGIQANNSEQLNSLAQEVYDSCGNRGFQVKLDRPFERRFPLDGIHIGTGIVAGYLPDGQTVLVEENRQPIILYFDDNGKFVREEQRDFSDHLRKPFPYSWEECDPQELIEVLRKEIGFQPAPIYVREFSSSLGEVELRCWGIHEEELQQPGRHDPEQSEKIGAELHFSMKWGQFSLSVGNTIYWPDSLGRVQTY